MTIPYRPLITRRPVRAVTLTARQRDVLDGLCDGWSNAQIGRELGASEDTGSCYVKQLIALCGARNRTEVVALVLTGRVQVWAPERQAAA